MSQRPSNWYTMSQSEQQAWHRAERAREDAEYDREQTERLAEREASRANDLRRQLDTARHEIDEYREDFQQQIERLEEEVNRAKNATNEAAAKLAQVNAEAKIALDHIGNRRANKALASLKAIEAITSTETPPATTQEEG